VYGCVDEIGYRLSLNVKKR